MGAQWGEEDAEDHKRYCNCGTVGRFIGGRAKLVSLYE